MAQKHYISCIEHPMTVATTEQGPHKRYRRLRFPSFDADVWANKNPLLQKGELGHEKDTGRFKVGDGVTYWLDLPYNSVGDPAKVNGHNVLEIIAGKNVEIEQSGNVLTIGASGAGYTKQEVDDKFTVANAQIDANAVAIAKTRDDYMSADTDIMTIVNNHAEELTTLRGNQASLGDQVAGIEEKIPESASGTNPLITKQQLLDEEMDIRDDVNEMVSELQTQITAQAAAIATLDSEKLDKNQGSINAGKVLTVGEDGLVVPTDGGTGGGLQAVSHDETLTGEGTDSSPLGVAKNLSVEELTVGTDEGTLNLSITAGVATIATNNGLDIVSQTKFDKAPTTDDNTTWADALDTSLVRKAQVASAMAGFEALPDQSGNSGKFLTTDGTTASWSDKPLVNKSTTTGSLAVGGANVTRQYVTLFGVYAGGSSADFSTIVGYAANSRGNYGVAIGYSATVAVNANNAIQLGTGTNKDANTFKVSNANGNFEMMSADGTIPAERMSATAGTTGQVLTKTDTGMAWQDASGGSLPDNVLVNTADADTSMTIGGNKATQTSALNIGWNSSCTGDSSVALGASASTSGSYAIVLGQNSSATKKRGIAIGRLVSSEAEFAIQLGGDSFAKNTDANTFKVGNANGNFELMSADGTIPADRIGNLDFGTMD